MNATAIGALGVLLSLGWFCGPLVRSLVLVACGAFYSAAVLNVRGYAPWWVVDATVIGGALLLMAASCWAVGRAIVKAFRYTSSPTPASNETWAATDGCGCGWCNRDRSELWAVELHGQPSRAVAGDDGD